MYQQLYYANRNTVITISIICFCSILKKAIFNIVIERLKKYVFLILYLIYNFDLMRNKRKF